MNVCRSLSFLCILICIACSKPLPQLEGIEREKWAADKNGCSNARSSMIVAIDREKEKLLALDQMQIVNLLGRPDRNELSTRNQKFFDYFLEPGPACANGNSTARKLQIRFNAVGLAKEVALVKGE